MVYGVWCMVYTLTQNTRLYSNDGDYIFTDITVLYGIDNMVAESVYGVWCMVYDVWCMVYGVC